MDFVSMSGFSFTNCMWLFKLHFFSLDQYMGAALNIGSNWASLKIYFLAQGHTHTHTHTHTH